jgi:hypothetical protein
MALTKSKATYAILGNVHGHLQLALCTLARLQCERTQQFDAVFLVGDVGTFTDDARLDSATYDGERIKPEEAAAIAAALEKKDILAPAFIKKLGKQRNRPFPPKHVR